MTYGQVLRRVIEGREDVSAAELARRIGKSRGYVSQLMSGQIVEPSLSIAYAIADALGMTVQDFLDMMEEE